MGYYTRVVTQETSAARTQPSHREKNLEPAQKALFPSGKDLSLYPQLLIAGTPWGCRVQLKGGVAATAETDVRFDCEQEEFSEAAGHSQTWHTPC